MVEIFVWSFIHLFFFSFMNWYNKVCRWETLKHTWLEASPITHIICLHQVVILDCRCNGKSDIAHKPLLYRCRFLLLHRVGFVFSMPCWTTMSSKEFPPPKKFTLLSKSGIWNFIPLHTFFIHQNKTFTLSIHPRITHALITIEMKGFRHQHHGK